MSDINKLVAAILTAGRMQAKENTEVLQTSRDWMTEYNITLAALNVQDIERNNLTDAASGKDTK